MTIDYGFVDELKEEYGLDEEAIIELYEKLLEKRCVNQGTEEQLKNCLEYTVSERASVVLEINREISHLRIKTKKRIAEIENDAPTEEYTISNALFEEYGDSSIPELDQTFIKERGSQKCIGRYYK